MNSKAKTRGAESVFTTWDREAKAADSRLSKAVTEAKKSPRKTQGYVKQGKGGLTWIQPPHLPKKEVLKLKAGTWIELWWEGEEAYSVALLIEKPADHRGDVSLRCLHFDDAGKVVQYGSPVHSQVVRALGELVLPKLSFATRVDAKAKSLEAADALGLKKAAKVKSSAR